MAAAQKPEPGTAVATREQGGVTKRVDARLAELRERNELVAAIRGTQWGKDITPQVARAVAHYCNTNGLDPVRHVEILGGKIYLTAEFYEERGAPLLLTGAVRKADPDFINADSRLDKLAAEGDEWAVGESTRRIRLRIQHGVPEKAAAAVVQRFTLESGAQVIGVNWCGGTGRRDPVGDAEPSKTAITRAARRAWKQIAEVIPGYGAIVKPLEASARIASNEIPVEVVDAPCGPKALVEGGYGDAGAAVNNAPVPPAQHADDPAGRDDDFEDEDWQDDTDIDR
jgi:hypothetical protein